MRILIHDYCGHPFQVQLSRALAARGHEVLHLYSGSIDSPRGALQNRPDDPGGLHIEAVSLPEKVAKYDYLKRHRQELRYGKLLADRVATSRPEIVVSANTPIDILSAMDRSCRGMAVPWVLWLQDIQSVAIREYAARKLPVVGALASRYYAWKERGLLRAAAKVVAISEGFLPVIQEIGGDPDEVVVIENWAPLEELPQRSRRNAWSAALDLDDCIAFVYSGTLGVKHNPRLLLELARNFGNRGEVRVVVVSEGPGADFLEEKKAESGVDNLMLLPWQPFEDLPNVLASADVLLAILEREAGVLSVPSKVLSNMCAGRPQLLAVPPENLASQLLLREQAGLCVAPDDQEAWLRAAERLLDDESLRGRLGANARAYAERAFDIERITDRFEALLRDVLAGDGPARSTA